MVRFSISVVLRLRVAPNPPNLVRASQMLSTFGSKMRRPKKGDRFLQHSCRNHRTSDFCTRRDLYPPRDLSRPVASTKTRSWPVFTSVPMKASREERISPRVRCRPGKATDRRRCNGPKPSTYPRHLGVCHRTADQLGLVDLG